MDQDILKLLVELAKSGGQTVIWVIFAIQVMKTITSSFGWVFILWIVKIITGAITNIIKFCIERDARILEREVK